MKPSNTSVADSMRQEAEKLAQHTPSVIAKDLTKEEALLQIKKLEIRIAELELQNEKLATNNADNKTVAHQQSIFFEQTPTAYLVVSETGEIITANNKGGIFVGKELSQLKNINFSALLAPDQDFLFHKFLQTIFKNKNTETIELVLKKNAPSIVTITAVFIHDIKQCLLQITDNINLKAEFELLQQERGFIQDILNSQPAGIYRIRVFPIEKWGKDGWKNAQHPPYIMEFLNDHFCNILGVDYESFKIHPGMINELIYPQDKAEFVRLNEEANQKNIPFRWEGRIIVSNKIKWIHLESTPRIIESGEILWTGLLYDITEAKQLEADLKLSEIKFKNVFDHSIVGKSLTTLNGELNTNIAFEEILGYSKEELQNVLWKDITFQEDIQLNADLLKKVISGELNSGRLEKRFIHKNGSLVWVDLSTTLLRDDNNIPLFYVTEVINITERKQTELALKESEEKLRTLFASMTEMVVMHELVFDENGNAINYLITDCNSAFTNITGIERQDALGKLATEVYGTNSAPYMEQYAHVAITGQAKEFDSYFAPMDKHFLISAIAPERNKFATISTDVTALQQIQQQISMKNKELEDYLYIASHDLRSPLVNIQGFSQRLQKQADKIKSQLENCEIDPIVKTNITKITAEEIPKTLDFIFTSVTKMETLISGLLQLSRTGRIKISIGRVDMTKLIKTVLEAHNYQISNIASNIIVEDLPDCYGDEQQLNQLFSNLISNAIKYRDIDRNFEIKIKAINSFNRVIYCIADNGIGIAPKFHEKIWNIFYRIHPQSLISGDGMGLSVVKQIAEKHHGKVWVESDEGQGSTFYIELQKNNWE
jgi:PAS domain S-box-containing protein